MDRNDLLPIGDVATRSGVAASALRFYESEGLISAERSAGGRRMFRRHVLRRIAFIWVAQRVGLSLEEIADALSMLPADRAPTVREWSRISGTWHARIDEQIAALERTRDDLTSCIGCGCLSLSRCRLYNPGDAAAALGDGPRFLLGDEPDDVPSPSST
ncbi:MAG: redox-sensitive transcriptional activator SoxR [Actinomycetota bacterium]